MTTIGLLSDTHGYMDDAILDWLRPCDEVWHGGDFGPAAVADAIAAACSDKPFRGVYGNIDGPDIRSRFPEELLFTCEAVPVFIKHIGGYPGRYAPGVKNKIQQEKPLLFISGHSHILKVQYDQSLKCLHINPGAAGKQGWHQQRTLIRFAIDGNDIKNCEVIELGKR